MVSTLMILQAVIAILLIVVVLVQFGKGAEAGLFSGAGDSVFTGSQRGNIFTKITVVLALAFLGNSILLARLQGAKTQASALDNLAPVARPLNSDAVAAPTPAAGQATEEAMAAPTPATTK